MTHESRRSARIAVSFGHILVQVLLIVILLFKAQTGKANSTEYALHEMKIVLYIFSAMLASFFIYYTTLKLLSRNITT